MKKRLDELRLSDFDEASVWASDGNSGVVPRGDLNEIPDGTENVFVLVHGKLADTTPISGIARVSCPPPLLTVHVLFVDGQKHSLRIPPAPEDVLAEEGPEALARKLDRTPAQVFPMWIRAEVKAECTGDNISQEIDVTGLPK